MPAIVARICWPCLFVGLLLLSASAAAIASDGPSWEALGTGAVGALVAAIAWFLLYLKAKADAAMVRAQVVHEALTALQLHIVETHPTFEDMDKSVGTSIRLALAENLPRELASALAAALSPSAPHGLPRSIPPQEIDR